MTVAAFALAAALSLVCGCAAYRPAPILPAIEARKIEARTLEDPGLRLFVEKALGHDVPAWPPKSWGPSMLTLASLYYHQDVAIARAAVGVAEAGVITAGARPNPALPLSVGRAVNNAPSPWLFSVFPAIPVETAGKRTLRIRAAQRQAEVARMQLAETAWSVRARLRLAFLDFLMAGRNLDLARKEERVRARVAALIEQRFLVGAIPRPDLDTAQIDLASARLAERAAKGALSQARVALATAIGVPAAALEGERLVWPDFDAPPGRAPDPGEVQRTAVLNRLDIRRSLDEYAVSEAVLESEIAKQYPDFRFGPGYNFDAGTNKYTVGVSVALPVFNRNQGPIAEAGARRKQAAERFSGLQAQAIGQAAKALAGYEAALAALKEAATALKTARGKERLVRQSFEKGESDRLSVEGSALQTVVAERAESAALGFSQAALGDLENAVQKPLEPAWLVRGLPTSDRAGSDLVEERRP